MNHVMMHEPRFGCCCAGDSPWCRGGGVVEGGDLGSKLVLGGGLGGDGVEVTQTPGGTGLLKLYITYKTRKPTAYGKPQE